MELYFNKVRLGIILITLLIVSSLTGACATSINWSPKISSLKADKMYVYPRQSVELECTASDPDGDTITYGWSCTDGEFTGTGPTITWKAPNAYGTFHIMVIVEDDKGNSAKDNLSIGVVANKNEQQGCSTCPNR